jgi:sterol desaturase/sphingolipid hydroxylase (fatty acid hydroxylase superfamily)
VREADAAGKGLHFARKFGVLPAVNEGWEPREGERSMETQAVPEAAGSAIACIISLVMLAMIAFWLWMLIDVITKCPSEENKKLIWILVVVFTGAIGAAVYYFVQRPKNPPGGPPPGA